MQMYIYCARVIRGTVSGCASVESWVMGFFCFSRSSRCWTFLLNASFDGAFFVWRDLQDYLMHLL